MRSSIKNISPPLSNPYNKKGFSLFKPHMALPILWENNHYAIIQKPSDLASHPGPKTAHSVENSLNPQKRGGPWLAHRLDRDTAGCLLIAKRKQALIKAQSAFQMKKTQKIYWALIDGDITSSHGTCGEIKNYLKRVSNKEGWFMTTCQQSDPKAEIAHTSWKFLGAKTHNNHPISWLELTLHTGRTHQARIHCAASLGHPILGDKIYSKPHQKNDSLRLQLLAKKLTIFLDQEEISAESHPEKEMQNLITHILS